MEIPAPSPAELAIHLSGAPGSKERFGKGAAEVLATARLVTAASGAWDKKTLSAFLLAQKLNPQVWDKLLGIARSTKLAAFPQNYLPSSYTALYSLVVMSPEEFEAAINEDVVTATASSRSILDWTKLYRLRGTGIEQEIPMTLVLREDLNEHKQQELLNAIQEVAGRFGAEVLQGRGGIKQAEVKADLRKAKAQQVEEELIKEIGTVVSDAPDELKIRFGITSAADLIEAPKATFTGFFQNLEGKVKGAFWRNHGRAYCLKIARDFNLTNSRAERYQLKDRIQKAVDKCSKEIEGFEEMVADVRSRYMNS